MHPISHILEHFCIIHIIHELTPFSPSLTWRDVQYLLAYTSNPDILIGDDWVTNGGGLKVSHHFGFGAIDAEAMVSRAKQWINVAEQHTKNFYSSLSSG